MMQFHHILSRVLEGLNGGWDMYLQMDLPLEVGG